jgi:hypothetical protein
MRDLALLVPSRGRPQSIARLVDAMDKTCHGNTALIVGVDEDDPELPAYQALGGCHVIVRPSYRGRLVEWLNYLARQYHWPYRALGHIGDDNVPHTPGWDVRIMESLETNLFCFGDDLDPGRPAGSLSIHIFMRSEVVTKLGYMGPPSIQHMYVDPVWYAWGQATSIEFLPDVVLEHLHYSLGRSTKDASYEHSTGLIPRDCEAYNAYCDDPNGLNADIRKLGGVPFSVEGLQEFNRRLNIPRVWAA